MVKVTGCDGDIVNGVMNIVGLIRPGSLQLDNPTVIGNPMPLVSPGFVSQRRIRGHAPSADIL